MYLYMFNWLLDKLDLLINKDFFLLQLARAEELNFLLVCTGSVVIK